MYYTGYHALEHKEHIPFDNMVNFLPKLQIQPRWFYNFILNECFLCEEMHFISTGLVQQVWTTQEL